MQAPARAPHLTLQTTDEQPRRAVTDSLRHRSPSGVDAREVHTLVEVWERRPKAVVALMSNTPDLRRLVRHATAAELLALIDAASSPGVTSADDGPRLADVGPLVEFIAIHGTLDALVRLRAAIDARGPAWATAAGLLACPWATDMLCD